MRLIILSLALAAAVIAPAMAGAASCQSSRGRTGDFDHYLLSLSWSPTFCASPAGRSNPRQCGDGGRGFVVHGLWPQYSKGGWPQCCGGTAPFDAAAVPADVSRVMIGKDLQRHQWTKHGACATARPDEYFRRIGQAVAAYGLAETVTPSRIKVSALKSHWPKLPPAAITIRCAGARLSEVRLCLDKSLAPMDCPKAVTDGDNCPGTVTLGGD
jgi:ribonuclease T2